MSTSPEGAATFFKTWKSTFVGHLGLQSMSYRVGTPCKNLLSTTKPTWKVILYSFATTKNLLSTTKPTLLTLLRIPFLGRIGSISYVLPIRQNIDILNRDIRVETIQISCQQRGGLGQKMAIFCWFTVLSILTWVGGPKKAKNMLT